jgi:hypothetical protein
VAEKSEEVYGMLRGYFIKINTTINTLFNIIEETLAGKTDIIAHNYSTGGGVLRISGSRLKCPRLSYVFVLSHRALLLYCEAAPPN